MWAVLWNAWLFGNDVRVHDKLNFSWATDPIEFYNKSSIYHNAGVLSTTTTLFFKSDYINHLPYNFIKKENFSKNFCSIKYVEEILKTKKVSCLL